MSSTSTVRPEVRMAHEITRQFAGEPAEEVAEMAAQHLRRFWAPTMIDRLVAEADRGAAVDPVVARLVEKLR